MSSARPRVTLPIDNIPGALSLSQRAYSAAVLDAKTRIKSAGKIVIPVGQSRDGHTHMRDTLRVTSFGNKILVEITAPYAGIVDVGARPHEIRGTGKPLSFFWQAIGMKVAFWKVAHPGFPGRQYWAAVVAIAKAVLRQTILEHVSRAFGRRA